MFKLFESSDFLRRVSRLLPFAFCLLPFALFSQPGTWVAVYGGNQYDRGRGIDATTDKGYVVCGPTSSYGIGNTDFYLLKIDSAGKFEWERTYGGSDWDFAYWTEQTNDGGYILAGESYSYGNNTQAWMVRTDSNGDTLWTRSFGGSGIDAVKEAHETADGGFVFGGYTATVSNDVDFYLIRTDANGDTLWTRTYGSAAADSASSVALCTDGGFLLGGCRDTLIGTANEHKTYFIKTDSNGNELLSMTNMAAPGNRSITRILETKDSQIAFLQITDDIGQEIRLDKYSGIWFQWARSLGGNDDEEGYDLVQNSDSGFALVGYTSTFGTGPDNIFIAKTAPDGNYISAPNIYTSIENIETQNENTLIYPNPFSEYVHVALDKTIWGKEKIIHITLTDLSGREMMSQEKELSVSSPDPLILKVPAEALIPGMYFLNLSSANRSLHRKLLFMR